MIGLLEGIDVLYGILENTLGRNHIHVTNPLESERVSLECIWELTPKRNHINTASVIKNSQEKSPLNTFKDTHWLETIYLQPV